MNEELNKAFEQISDEHINEAAGYQKPRFLWLKAIAAVLAVVIAWTAIWAALDFPPTIIFPADTSATEPQLQESDVPPDLFPDSPLSPDPNSSTEPGPILVPLSNPVAKPVYPELGPQPSRADFASKDEYLTANSAWREAQEQQYSQPEGYADSLNDFWSRSLSEFLSGSGNRVCSPVNVYMALAMLAETAGGNSRQQILDLLGAGSIEELRTQAGYVWNAHFSDDGTTDLLLGNSVWLDNEHDFYQNTVNTLAENYYASVYAGDLGSGDMNQALQDWLDDQTKDLLTDQSQKLELDPNTVFALASTIYFKAEWNTVFSENETTDGIFHGSSGDVTASFMHRSSSETYYWGEDFCAVRISLTGRNGMWLILPDDDKTAEDVLASDEYTQMLQTPYAWENQKTVQVNLSMPKFDITASKDLVTALQNIGVTNIFSLETSDLSPMTDDDVYVSQIDHAVRFAVSEGGVLAAAYTVIEAPSYSMPPDEEVDFVLDRPFLFVVSSRDNLPLFAGVVEQP